MVTRERSLFVSNTIKTNLSTNDDDVIDVSSDEENDQSQINMGTVNNSLREPIVIDESSILSIHESKSSSFTSKNSK